MISREEYIKELHELLSDDPTMAKGREEEIIYQIDDLNIYGGFEMGVRGNDHRILLFDDVSWENILNWGTVVVPETQSYISNHIVDKFENIGFEILPTDDNHLIGFKDINETPKMNIDKEELLDPQNVENREALFLNSENRALNNVEVGNSIAEILVEEKPNKFEQRKAAAVKKNKMIERTLTNTKAIRADNDGPSMK